MRSGYVSKLWLAQCCTDYLPDCFRLVAVAKDRSGPYEIPQNMGCILVLVQTKLWWGSLYTVQCMPVAHSQP